LESTLSVIKKPNPEDGRDVWTKKWTKQAKKIVICQEDDVQPENNRR
jgi:hypothetical protein